MHATLTLSLLLAGAARGAEGGAPPAKEAQPALSPAEAAISTTTRPPALEDIYWGDKFRDPFSKATVASGGSGKAAKVEYSPEDFSIHELELKGVLKDKTGDFAILVDPRSGMGFMLRGGKLYDAKNALVRGVTGRISVAQKSITLITADKDVQILRLGETEEEAEDEKDKPDSAPAKKEKAS